MCLSHTVFFFHSNRQSTGILPCKRPAGQRESSAHDLLEWCVLRRPKLAARTGTSLWFRSIQVPGFNNLEPLWKIVENHKHLEPVVEYTLSRPAIQSPHRKQEGNRKAGRSRTSLVRREMPACRLSGRFEDDGEKQVPRGHGASALSTATLPIPLIPECGTTF